MHGVVTPYVGIGDVGGGYDEVGRIEDSLKLLELERTRLSDSLVKAKASQASRMSFYVPAPAVAPVVGLPAATPQLHSVFPGTWIPPPAEVVPPPLPVDMNTLSRHFPTNPIQLSHDTGGMFRDSELPPTPTATRRPAISPTRRQIVTPRVARPPVSQLPFDNVVTVEGSRGDADVSIFQNPTTLSYPALPVVKPVVTLSDINRERIVSSHMVYNTPEIQRSRDARDARVASRKVGQIEKDLIEAESRAVDAATRFVRSTTTPAMPTQFVDLLDSTPAAVGLPAGATSVSMLRNNEIPTLPPSNFAGPLHGGRLASAALSESSVPSHPPASGSISPTRDLPPDNLPPGNYSAPTNYQQSAAEMFSLGISPTRRISGGLPPGNIDLPPGNMSPTRSTAAGITISKTNPQRATSSVNWNRPIIPPAAWTPKWWTQVCCLLRPLL